jgi:hypothetical protein
MANNAQNRLRNRNQNTITEIRLRHLPTLITPKNKRVLDRSLFKAGDEIAQQIRRQKSHHIVQSKRNVDRMMDVEAQGPGDFN